jgi:hypothetical protein
MYSSKPVIFVVISFLVIGLIYSSVSIYVFAVPKDKNFGGNDCANLKTGPNEASKVKCCWRERVPGQFLAVEYCQTCTVTKAGQDCTQKELQFREQPPTADETVAPQGDGVLEQPPTPPPSGPVGPLKGGILEQLEQGEGLQQGFFEQQQQQPSADQGAAELPPTTTEETQPATVEEEPSAPVCQGGLEFNEDLGFCVPEDCPEGQVLDEDSGICVLEEPETAEEEPAQSDPEEEQPPEEGDGSEDNSNNGDNN